MRQVGNFQPEIFVRIDGLVFRDILDRENFLVSLQLEIVIGQAWDMMFLFSHSSVGCVLGYKFCE